MKSHVTILVGVSLLLVTISSTSQGSWLSKEPLTKAGTWIAKQSGSATQQVKAQNDPAKIRETATAAIDANNAAAQKAFSDQKVLIDEANAKLDLREKIFSGSVIGLFVSNGVTIYGLFAGRRRSKEELRGLQLENEKKALELQELKNRLPPKLPNA